MIPEEVSRSLYDSLKKALESRIIPVLIKNDFRQFPHPKFHPKPDRRERAYNPHGIFRRRSGFRDDLIEIVYQDRKYPQFHIYFGVAPHHGVRVRGVHFLPENMGVSESPVSYSLSSSPRSFQPFAVIWPLAGEERIPRIVGEAEKVLPQVFDWFDHGLVGPNLFGGSEPTVSEIVNKRAG